MVEKKRRARGKNRQTRNMNETCQIVDTRSDLIELKSGSLHGPVFRNNISSCSFEITYSKFHCLRFCGEGWAGGIIFPIFHFVTNFPDFLFPQFSQTFPHKLTPPAVLQPSLSSKSTNQRTNLEKYFLL